MSDENCSAEQAARLLQYEEDKMPTENIVNIDIEMNSSEPAARAALAALLFQYEDERSTVHGIIRDIEMVSLEPATKAARLTRYEETVSIDIEILLSEQLKEYKSIIRSMFEFEKASCYCELSDCKLMKFLDFLMPDWKYKIVKISDYDLIVKNIAIVKLTSSGIFEHMLHLMKTKNKALFHHAAYRILIQFIHEKVENKEDFYEWESEPADKMRQLDGINEEYYKNIHLLLAYHSHPEPRLAHEYRKDDLLDLVEYLKCGRFSKFEHLFKKHLENEKCKYGSYYEVSFKPLARFYYNIAKTRHFTSVVELIFRLCPHVDENSCMVTNFYQERNLWIIDKDDENKRLRCETKEIYKTIIHFKTYKRILFDLELPEGFHDNFEILVRAV